MPNPYKAKFTELHLLTNSEIMSLSLNSRVHFFFVGSRPAIRNRIKLKAFILTIFRSEKTKLGSINFIFTDDKEIHEINKRYLGHDFYTDIVTFELSDTNHPVIAEVYISCERVRENASLQKTSFREELHRVIFHGVLHLCGFKDKTAAQIREMRTRENAYLSRYFK